MDCLEIWSEDYQDTNRKSHLGNSISQNGSPIYASTVLCIGRIFISKLDRLIAKQPIKIPTVLKTTLLGLGL